jgi:beta-phosphoglucomutase family hydrolase
MAYVMPPCSATSRTEARGGLPARIRACLFDLDGVLTSTAVLHAKAWKRTFDSFLRARSSSLRTPFIEFDPIRDYDPYVDGKPREAGARSFLLSRGIRLPEGSEGDPTSVDTVRGLAVRKDQLLLAMLRDEGVRAYPGSVRYVRAVREAGMRTAVVSSSRNCHEVLVAAGIAELFEARVDGVFAAERHLKGKPAPDTYLAAARALAIAPEQAAVFEDALAGVEAGRSGGFGFVVGVDRAGQAESLMRQGADVVVSDLSELLSTP